MQVISRDVSISRLKFSKKWTVLAILVTVATSSVKAATKEIGTGLLSPKLNGSDVIYTPQIVGGLNGNISDFPYQVSLQYYGQHICGGSILNSRTILTAAHCTNGMSASSLSIRAGSTYHASGGQRRQVSRFIQHTQYNSNTQDRDVSILILASDLEFNQYVQPIDLASKPVKPGDNAVCSGWGSLAGGGSSPSNLQYVFLKLISKEECATRYSGAATVTNNMICTFNNGQDACQGDSGGPLVADGESVGVVSWGIGCAHPKYPGVYADVYRLKDFITQNVDL